MPANAGADPGLIVGFADDSPKWYGAEATDAGRAAGATAFRITLLWEPGRTELDAVDRAELARAVAATADMRLVVSVFADSADDAPTDARRRDDYCSFVSDLVSRYRSVRDVVIWNEPNKSFFWRPQFDERGASVAPAAYTALAARCWDVLHAARADVNVIAPATSPRGGDDPDAAENVSHSPGAFIEKMGEAYRASGRTRPLFDTVGHHAYGISSA